MRILIDILHPAHVHIYRNFRVEMLGRGHEVLVTARDKDVTVGLMNRLRIPHATLSVQRTGIVGLATELVQRSLRLHVVAGRFRPDVMTGIMGPSIAPVGRLLRVPSVVFYDTEIARATNVWVYPLTTAVCTPDSYSGPVRGNHITYPGYHELAYLHPNRFTPDRTRLAAFGLSQPYSFVRFVSWRASHDIGEQGLAQAQKRALVEALAIKGTVAISAEGPLPADLEPLRLKGPVDDIHHVLAHAQVFVGESPTMSSEAALLGIPTILIARRTAGVLDDQEQYGILRRIEPSRFDEILTAIDDTPEVGAHARLLDDKVDLTEWMVHFFENKGWRSS